jgi:hypothetical protein
MVLMPSQRIRAIKPEVWTLPSTAALSYPARILRLAMHNWANDYGYGETNLTMLLGLAFPESDGVTLDDLKGYLSEIAAHCDVAFYGIGGRHYFCIGDWEEYQRVDTRNKQPYPTPGDPGVAIDERFHHFPRESRGIPWNPQESPPGSGDQGIRGTEDLGIGGSADLGISGSGDSSRCFERGVQGGELSSMTKAPDSSDKNAQRNGREPLRVLAHLTALRENFHGYGLTVTEVATHKYDGKPTKNQINSTREGLQTAVARGLAVKSNRDGVAVYSPVATDGWQP